MPPNVHEYIPEPAFWSQDELGNWIPRYVRGVGSTPELAKLHADLVRADVRFRIACDQGLNGPSRLERP